MKDDARASRLGFQDQGLENMKGFRASKLGSRHFRLGNSGFGVVISAMDAQEPGEVGHGDQNWEVFGRH